MTNPNDPAFSRAAFYHPDGGYIPAQEGMTIREYFAAMAMQGYLVNNAKAGIKDEDIATWSVEAADALIKALNEIKP